MSQLEYTVFETAFGHMGIVYRSNGASAKAVHILLPRSKRNTQSIIKDQFPQALKSAGDEVSELRNRIQDFFLGDPNPIPLSLVDISICRPFQLSVLKEEHAIARGKTSSYWRIANRLNSRAVRAVGSALARNPFPIVIPCHRAVRSDLTLGGYQGGLEMKRQILSIEGVEFDSRGRVLPDCFLG
ncbi:MAG: methylated-DNA--[protein]-cysteine S-methyltransferase [Candidatus Thorarchaeota archaeon]